MSRVRLLETIRAGSGGSEDFVVFRNPRGLPLRGFGPSVAVDARGERFEPVAGVLAALGRRKATQRTVAVAYGDGPLIDCVRLGAGLYRGGIPVIVVATSLGALLARATDPVARRGEIALERPPLGVLFDERDFGRTARDGLALLARNALIEGHDLFESLETLAPHAPGRWPWAALGADALHVDRMHRDGERAVFSLGAPFARAIAQTAGLRPQPALALGLRAAALAGRAVTGLPRADHLRLVTVLALLGYPLFDERIEPNAVLAALPRDATFAIPHAIGDVEAHVKIPRATLRRIVTRLASPPGAVEFR
jgi:3-dehydroquinate synthetase